jgi:hypothetical protein
MHADIPPMTPDRWMANLLEAAGGIADKKKQESRWLAVDPHAWERPEELINALFDDANLELFLTEYASTFTEEQRLAGSELRDDLNCYSDAAPGWLDAAEVLADPRWDAIRQKASAFVAAFKGS